MTTRRTQGGTKAPSNMGRLALAVACAGVLAAGVAVARVRAQDAPASGASTAAGAPASRNATAASPAVPVEGNARNGARLFASYGCFECHGRVAQGASTGPRLGPHPISIAGMIRELRHPNEMPPYSEKVISDAEIADIHAFLGSLPEPPMPDSIPLLSRQSR